MIWLQLLWCQPFCHSDHSTLLFFTRTCITGCKAQSSGFVLANTHLAMVENDNELSNSQPDARERKTSAKSQQSKVECEKLCSNLNINNVLAWISKSVKPELLPGVNHKWIKQAPEKQAAMTVSILTCQCHPASLCFLFGIRLEKKLHLRLGRCSVHTDEGCHL